MHLLQSKGKFNSIFVPYILFSSCEHTGLIMVTTLSHSSLILFSSWLHTGQILVSSLLHLGFVRLTSWSLPIYILVPSSSHPVLVLVRPLVFVLVLSRSCPGSPLSPHPGVPLFTSWSCPDYFGSWLDHILV